MIVQKFGGTSLGRQGGFKRIVEIVKQVSTESNLIVVVSAFSNAKKTEGITSKLMQASQLAVKGKSGFLKIIQEIEKLHIKLVESNIKNEANKKAITEEIKEILKKTKNFLEATKIIGELTTRSIDNIISVICQNIYRNFISAKSFNRLAGNSLFSMVNETLTSEVAIPSG